MQGNERRVRTDRNQFDRLADDILERARVPGAPSPLSGAATASESAPFAGSGSTTGPDGVTAGVFIFGVSTFGGPDVLAPYSRAAVAYGSLTKRLS